jgi:hypothetical protein
MPLPHGRGTEPIRNPQLKDRSTYKADKKGGLSPPQK